MRFILLFSALLLLMDSASAQSGHQGMSHKRCWAQTDPRGYGFWDECADPKEAAEENRHQGYRGYFPTPKSGAYDNSSSIGNGGGGGGGGK
jgi:hypothetical protein